MFKQGCHKDHVHPQSWQHTSHCHCQSMTLCINLCAFLMHLQSISEALLCTLTHCVLDSACYATMHCPLHLHLCTCHPCLFVCLFVSSSRLFLLIDGQWTSAKSDCT